MSKVRGEEGSKDFSIKSFSNFAFRYAKGRKCFLKTEKSDRSIIKNLKVRSKKAQNLNFLFFEVRKWQSAKILLKLTS